MAQPSHIQRISFDLFRLVRILAIGSVLVVMLGVLREFAVAAMGHGTPLKDLRHIALDEELSLPAWYSSMLLLAAAALLFVIARAARRDGDMDAARWLGLAVLFCLMSLDEAASFHESLMMPLRHALGATGIFYYAWVVPGAIGVLAIGLYYLPFLLRLPRQSMLLIGLAGALYVGGALGVEFAGGALEEAVGKDTLLYSVVSVIEESLEIAGLTVFVAALAIHLQGRWPSLAVDFAGPRPSRG